MLFAIYFGATVEFTNTKLALALLVTQIFTNHHHAPMPTNDLAFFADPLDAGIDLHGVPFP